MKDRSEILDMRERSYAEVQAARAKALDLRRAGDEEGAQRQDEAAAFAEGTEAGLLWALGHAGAPFQHDRANPRD